MTNTGLADQPNRLTDEHRHITRATVAKLFVMLAAVSFILRIFYAGHLYEDDGLWFTAGEQMLRGKALYSEIYFDKPPFLPLVYASLFWIFGAHILTIRLFTIAYAVATSGVLYLFGSRLYNRRVGLLAAAMFSVFSTTYPHFQMLSTDFLMMLPYSAGAYLLVRSRLSPQDASRDRSNNWLALAGGLFVGLAFQTNPKGILDLIFFGVFLLVAARWDAEDAKRSATIGTGQPSAGGMAFGTGAAPGYVGLLLIVLSVAGVVAISLPFLAYVAATRSLSFYWMYVWDWGARYGRYYSAMKIPGSTLSSGANYLALNNTLLIGLGFVVVTVVRRIRGVGADTNQRTGSNFSKELFFRADCLLLIWFVVSFGGVMLGGRFYAHYFLQILPSLCLITARGLTGIVSWLKPKSKGLRKAILAVLILGFIFTLVRFHTRGVMLAIDWARGTTGTFNATWQYNIRNHEERMVAAVVRQNPDEPEGADRHGLEGLRSDRPWTRASGPFDYLFVWGYRPEIYFWSGLLPASRFLSTQPLTGVPADVHYFGDNYRSILDETSTALARAELLGDLQKTRPAYIIDELGMYNLNLSITSYPELREFMMDYKEKGTVGLFRVYCRRDLLKKNLQHNRETER